MSSKTILNLSDVTALDQTIPLSGISRSPDPNDSVLNVCFPIDQEGCYPEEVLPSEVIKPIEKRMRTVFTPLYQQKSLCTYRKEIKALI